MIDNKQVAVSIRNNSFRMIKSRLSIDPVVCGVDPSHARHACDGCDNPVIANRHNFPNSIGRGVGDKKIAFLVHSNACRKTELGHAIDSIIGSLRSARERCECESLALKIACAEEQREENAACASGGELHRLYSEPLVLKLQ